MDPITHVALHKNAIYVFHVWIVRRAQVLLDGDDRLDTHTNTIAASVSCLRTYFFNPRGQFRTTANKPPGSGGIVVPGARAGSSVHKLDAEEPLAVPGNRIGLVIPAGVRTGCGRLKRGRCWTLAAAYCGSGFRSPAAAMRIGSIARAPLPGQATRNWLRIFFSLLLKAPDESAAREILSNL
ncbi:MAG: hypothetical protein HY820_05960 [Acidobacteria bacterium]|nr:hypothetical protein [Acidobacteriota bacterium]